MSIFGAFLVSAKAGTSVRHYRFRDVTARVGIPTHEVRSWGSAWSDFDHDGDVDLFEGLHGQIPRFWQNSDGAFSRYPTSNETFGMVDRHGCAWGEANGDAQPDLYCTVGARRGQGRGPNQLFLQLPVGLVDAADALGVRNPLGRGRTINWIDYDSDGDLDIFVGNDYRSHHPNVMFTNHSGEFTKVAVGVGHHLRTVSSSWSDWDGDRDPDLLVLQNPDRKRSFPAVAYQNTGAAFTRVPLDHVTGRRWRAASWGDYNADGKTDLHLLSNKLSLILKNIGGRFRVVDRRRLREGRMSAWLDVENDGDLDSLVVQGASGTVTSPGLNRTDFLINRGTSGFEKARGSSLRGPRIGNGDAVSVADFDGDGRSDIFVSNGAGERGWIGPPVLLKNRTRSGNWIRLVLEGDGWNPWGFGSRIDIRTPRRVYRHEITDGFNYRAQSDRSRLLFGIGQEARARVKVRWADGTTDCVAISAATTVTVPKGARDC